MGSVVESFLLGSDLIADTIEGGGGRQKFEFHGLVTRRPPPPDSYVQRIPVRTPTPKEERTRNCSDLLNDTCSIRISTIKRTHINFHRISPNYGKRFRKGDVY